MSKTNIKEDINSWLEESKEKQEEAQANIKLKDSNKVIIDGQEYHLIDNYREGFVLDSFKDRYQDYFSKFNYIVGDWAANQLRLRGFYEEKMRRVPQNQTAHLIQDYLLEYCNFGCAYFILHKQEGESSKDELTSTHTKPTSWGRKKKAAGKQKRKPKAQKPHFEIQENKPPQSTRPMQKNRKNKGNFTIINRGKRV